MRGAQSERARPAHARSLEVRRGQDPQSQQQGLDLVVEVLVGGQPGQVIAAMHRAIRVQQSGEEGCVHCGVVGLQDGQGDVGFVSLACVVFGRRAFGQAVALPEFHHVSGMKFDADQPPGARVAYDFGRGLEDLFNQANRMFNEFGFGKAKAQGAVLETAIPHEQPNQVGQFRRHLRGEVDRNGMERRRQAVVQRNTSRLADKPGRRKDHLHARTKFVHSFPDQPVLLPHPDAMPIRGLEHVPPSRAHFDGMGHAVHIKLRRLPNATFGSHAEADVLPLGATRVPQGLDGKHALVGDHHGPRDQAPRGRNGQLGRVADAVLLDALHDFVPVQFGTAPVRLGTAAQPVGPGGRLPFEVLRVVDAALDAGEGPPLPGQFDAGFHGMEADEFHDLGRELLGLPGAVADAVDVHQVGQAHDAQTDATVAVRGLFELRHRGHVGVPLHDVIQKAHRAVHGIGQFLPVHTAFGRGVPGQVDGTQATVLIGTQGLFAAGICGFNAVLMRNRVGPVDGIQEEHAWLAVVVGLTRDFVEKVPGPHLLVDLDGNSLLPRVLQGAVEVVVFRRGHVGEDQFPFLVLLHRAHEGIGDAHGDVEVGDGVLVRLAGDEFLHVGMVHPQHGHVGAASCSALRNLPKGVVVHPQEADGPRGLARGGFHYRALGPQAGKGKPIPPARLLNQGRIAQGHENARILAAHVVGDREDEARRELAQRRARAGPGGGIGVEEGFGQQAVEVLGPLDDLFLAGAKFFFRLGHVVGYPPEGLLRGFDGLPIQALAHIAFVKHQFGVVIGETDFGQALGQGRGGQKRLGRSRHLGHKAPP